MPMPRTACRSRRRAGSRRARPPLPCSACMAYRRLGIRTGSSPLRVRSVRRSGPLRCAHAKASRPSARGVSSGASTANPCSEGGATQIAHTRRYDLMNFSQGACRATTNAASSNWRRTSRYRCRSKSCCRESASLTGLIEFQKDSQFFQLLIEFVKRRTHRWAPSRSRFLNLSDRAGEGPAHATVPVLGIVEVCATPGKELLVLLVHRHQLLP